MREVKYEIAVESSMKYYNCVCFESTHVFWYNILFIFCFVLFCFVFVSVFLFPPVLRPGGWEENTKSLQIPALILQHHAVHILLTRK